MASSQLALTPEVLKRLHQLQQADRPVSVDEILQAANLNHLALPVQQPTQSKSAEVPRLSRRQVDNNYLKTNVTPPLRLKKSASTLTSAERRRIPVSPKKLTLNSSSSSVLQKSQNTSDKRQEQETNNTTRNSVDTIAHSNSSMGVFERLEKLEIEHAKGASHISVEYLLSHLDRQNAILQSEPNSNSTEFNQLQTDFDTIRHMIFDNNSADISQMPPLSSCQINKTNTSLLSETVTSGGTMDWDLWQYMVKDYPTAAAKFPHLVSASLHNDDGVPFPLRRVLWQVMAQSSSPRLESVYDRLIDGSGDSSSSYAQDIQRDLSYLFATVEMFKGDDGQLQQAMERLLTSYCIYDSLADYSQDLVFLAGPLLMMIPEKQAFCVFVRLMETHEMRTMFTLSKQGLHHRLYQFQTLLSQICPRLDAHLASHSIHPTMYARQWYLTLFASSLPLPMILRIYDLALAEGAADTTTRIALVMMQKNEELLLKMDDFDQIMMHLRSKEFYESAYHSNPGALIFDATALSHSITKTKMDAIAAMYDPNLELENLDAQQRLSLTCDDRKPSNTVNDTNTNNNNSSESDNSTATTKNKRDSWFSWTFIKPATTTTSTSDEQLTNTMSQSQQYDAFSMERTNDQQAEYLVTTLSQLQEDHSHLSEQVKVLKLDAMDYTATNNKLVERNSILERQVDKYNQQYQQLLSGGQSFASSSFSSPSLCPIVSSSNSSLSSLMDKANTSRLQVLGKDQEFCSFVTSLHSSGDFGALIAAALTTSTINDVASVDCLDRNECRNDNVLVNTMSLPRSAIEIEDASAITTAAIDDGEDAISKLDTATQELLAMKLANFEMGQKYEDVCHENKTLVKELAFSQDKEQMYLDQIALLEKVRADQAQEISIITNANEKLSERIMAIKQTSAELHMEKLSLIDQLSSLERNVNELQREKEEYLKPRDSFSEEVFAAHHTLFGEGSVYHQQQQQQQRQQPGLKFENNMNNDYQRKYVDSELRCRELEKLLAETKVKLVEYEATPSPTQKRPTSFAAIKGNGNSNIHGLVLTTRGMSTGIGSIPMTRDDSAATRASIDSMSTTTSSKRSSVYSRIWNSITTPTTPSAIDTLPFSNNHISNKLEDRYQSPTIIQPDFTL